jgi:hypothetical protein
MTQYLYTNKGIYKCNGKLFFNKIEAILEANTNNAYIVWDYHNDIFGKHNWQIDPPASLEEIYKQRAQQLRDNYDHLVLFYSGGVDSWYILNAFVKNNIKLDEIYMYGAFKAEEKEFGRLGWNQDPGYYTREIVQSLPLIKKLCEEKKIKVNVYDWTEDMLDAANDLDWILTAGVRYDPTAMARFKFHKIFREHQELTHKGKRVGFLFGVDKPRLLRDDHSIYFAFLDIIMPRGAMQTNDIMGEYWENDEYFYWTPNLPEIVIKQSHDIIKVLKATNRIHLIPHLNNVSEGHSGNYFPEINKIIYQDWDHNTWQIKKPTSDVVDQVGKWFLDGDYQAKQKWLSSVQELGRVCGNKWFNKNDVMNGFRGNLSPLYKVADYTVDH